jgi:hypothetical protein
MKLSRIVCRLFVALALAALSAESALAATTKTNDVNDPVNRPYMQSVQNNDCTGTLCELTFPAATAPTTLVQHISCNFRLGSNVNTTDAFAFLPHDSNQLSVFGYANSNVRATNDNVYLFVNRGESLGIDILTANGPTQQLTCTISGYHN